mmetsp:Transcript_159903/g.388316  ORF Transcript_159903/g.388316 Transcript_159903/m.388316 type:complete len:106 (+) Transcript_159903:291-608(+)
MRASHLLQSSCQKHQVREQLSLPLLARYPHQQLQSRSPLMLHNRLSCRRNARTKIKGSATLLLTGQSCKRWSVSSTAHRKLSAASSRLTKTTKATTHRVQLNPCH